MMSIAVNRCWRQSNRGDGGLTEKDLLQACGIAEFSDLFREIDGWVDANKAKIASAHLSFVPGSVNLTVVMRGVRFDRDFNKQLSQFDSRIARDERFNLIKFNTTVLPCTDVESVASFTGSRVILCREVSERSLAI